MVKTLDGGGGRGIRIVEDASSVDEAFKRCACKFIQHNLCSDSPPQMHRGKFFRSGFCWEDTVGSRLETHRNSGHRWWDWCSQSPLGAWMQRSASVCTLFNGQSSDLIATLSRFQEVVEVCYEVASLYRCAETVLYSSLHRDSHVRWSIH